jgi:aminopeptidase-like protein
VINVEEFSLNSVEELIYTLLDVNLLCIVLHVTTGEEIYSWIENLFPFNRSLSGEGNRKTLKYLQSIAPKLDIKSFRCGSSAFDWVVPNEWNVEDAYIELKDGTKIGQFSKNNLHLVGYSIPVDKVITKEELLMHLHYRNDLPNAIPYVTSYYEKNWGFCLKEEDLQALGDGPYRVVINSNFKSHDEGGVINYGEAVLPGKSKQEVLFSTYICHPSMANNELSGPALSTALIRYLSETNHHYTYRFLFLPETIGSLAYLSLNYREMKENLIAGWVLTCLGDNGLLSYIPSRLGNNYADRITKQILDSKFSNYNTYSWLDRGSDERQYCSPGIDLPICSVTRSKYDCYPEYHTSLDNLSLIDSGSLEDSYRFLKLIVQFLEERRVPKSKVLGEPQLGRRGLYSNISTNYSYDTDTRLLVDVISFLDGNHSIEELSKKLGVEKSKIEKILEILLQHDIISL